VSVDEETFLRMIASEDSDDARLVYADWLEERGDARAEYLRLEVSLHRIGSRPSPERRRLAELAERIDPAWRRRVDRASSGLGRDAAPRAEPPSIVTEHVPSWTRLRDEPGERGIAGGELAGATRRSIVDRLRSISLRSLVVPLLVLAAALGSSGCLFVTHLTCRPGPEGACSIDTYGLFTTVRHVDVPVHEIVEVSVDERTARRSPDTARVEIVTRSMGRIDLSGGQLVNVAGFATNDAVRAAAALRQLRPSGTSAPRDVDLWMGPPRVTSLFCLALSLVCWYVLAALVVRAVRPNEASDAGAPAER